MSVEIYNIEEGEDASTICLAVASERCFTLYRERAIADLKIKSLGNGVWLKREDINTILADFNKVKTWAAKELPETEAKYMISRIDRILDLLPKEWHSQFSRLWMG